MGFEYFDGIWDRNYIHEVIIIHKILSPLIITNFPELKVTDRSYLDPNINKKFN